MALGQGTPSYALIQPTNHIGQYLGDKLSGQSDRNAASQHDHIAGGGNRKANKTVTWGRGRARKRKIETAIDDKPVKAEWFFE